MIECYYRLRTDALMLCHNVMSTNLDDLQYQQYFNFDASVLGREEWLNNPALAQINQEFPIKQAGILKMDPHRGYDWHTDTERQLAINMVLPTVQSTKHPSETLFSLDQGQAMQYSFHRMSYQPGSLYLFNTQVPHTVINFALPRYLFSVEFLASDYTTYQNVRDYCLSNGL